MGKGHLTLAAALLCVVINPLLAAPAEARASIEQRRSVPCDSECLQARMEGYLQALTTGSFERLRFAPNLQASENGSPVRIGAGAASQIVRLGQYRITAVDPVHGQVGFVGVAQTKTGATMLAIRLKVIDAEISEAETIIPGATLPSVFQDAARSLLERRARAAFELPLSRSERRSRKVMIRAANSYYEGIERGSGRIVAFADDCHRIENGIAMVNNPEVQYPLVSADARALPNFGAMGCRAQFDTGMTALSTVTHRRFPLVDERTGVVFAFTRYNVYGRRMCTPIKGFGVACARSGSHPYPLDLLEVFKIRNGRIHEMESVWTMLKAPGASPAK